MSNDVRQEVIREEKIRGMDIFTSTQKLYQNRRQQYKLVFASYKTTQYMCTLALRFNRHVIMLVPWTAT